MLEMLTVTSCVTVKGVLSISPCCAARPRRCIVQEGSLAGRRYTPNPCVPHRQQKQAVASQRPHLGCSAATFTHKLRPFQVHSPHAAPQALPWPLPEAFQQLGHCEVFAQLLWVPSVSDPSDKQACFLLVVCILQHRGSPLTLACTLRSCSSSDPAQSVASPSLTACELAKVTAPPWPPPPPPSAAAG